MRVMHGGARLGIGVVQLDGRAYDPEAVFDLAIDEAVRLGLAQVRGTQNEMPKVLP